MRERKFKQKRYTQYGNLIEDISREETRIVDVIISRSMDRLQSINSMPKCFGDKVREVIKAGITNNTVLARAILEKL